MNIDGYDIPENKNPRSLTSPVLPGKKYGANFFRFKENQKQLSDWVWLIVGSPGPDDPKKNTPKMQQNPCPIHWRQRHFDSGCLSNHWRFKTDWTCHCLNKKPKYILWDGRVCGVQDPTGWQSLDQWYPKSSWFELHYIRSRWWLRHNNMFRNRLS